MIVSQIGYLKLSDVLKLEHFSIYKTNRKTQILIKNTSVDKVSLYYPDRSRLPWKDVEGKKICSGEKIFDSKINDELEIKHQIMAYEEFNIHDYNT